MTQQKSESTRKKPRRRGSMTSREAKHALRSKPPEINPCPPGQRGGQYKPL